MMMIMMMMMMMMIMMMMIMMIMMMMIMMVMMMNEMVDSDTYIKDKIIYKTFQSSILLIPKKLHV